MTHGHTNVKITEMHSNLTVIGDLNG